MPFPTDGGHQTITAQVNGGPLGGAQVHALHGRDASTTRRWRTFGGSALGAEPIVLSLGLTARGGRGVRRSGRRSSSRRSSRSAACSTASRCAATRSSRSRRPGITSERARAPRRSAVVRQCVLHEHGGAGLRINQQMYLDAFYDAGNIWARPRDFDPTRLFRGAGFGARSSRRSVRSGSTGVRIRSGGRAGPQGTQVAVALQARTALLTPGVFMRVVSFARFRSRSALVTLLAPAPPRRAQKIGYIRSSTILDRRPGRAEAEAQFERRRQATATRSSA